ncbi:MAG TPA: hypothetical protein VGK48_20615 [Terriglobia bacterium]|jgi:hypothetical protein
MNWIILLLAASLLPAPRVKDEKLKPEQLIAKHLASIGPADKLQAIKSRVTAGTTHVEFTVGGHASMDGDANIVSQGTSLRALFKYPSLDYPGELLAFDGKRTTVGQISPGKRSPLGNFLFHYDDAITHGLLFGVLSTSWALETPEGKKSRMEVSGPKKVDGKLVYELKYVPQNGSNLTAYFDFDAETFRHVRSQMKVEVVSARANQKITDSAETTLYTINENYSDFKDVDGLTLPYTYKMDFSIDMPGGGFVGSWTYTVKQVLHNQPIDAKAFFPQ